MKYLAVLVAILSLTACQTGNLAIVASQVQEITAATCKFIPTAATIGGILSADPRIATAESSCRSDLRSDCSTSFRSRIFVYSRLC